MSRNDKEAIKKSFIASKFQLPQVLYQKLEAHLRRAVEDKGDACIG